MSALFSLVGLIFLTQEFSRGFLQTKPLPFCLLSRKLWHHGGNEITAPGRHLCPGRVALAAYLQANLISFFLELFNARAAEGSETWDFASHGLSCRTFKEKFAQCLLGRDPGVGAKKEPFLPPYLISAQWVPETTCLRLAY